MKLQIKVKRHNNVPLPHFIEQGDWVDLTAAEDCKINRKSGYTSFSLGVSMELPEGYEAILAPRSSTPKKFGFLVPNSFGVIDNSYCGDNDVWMFPALATRDVLIEKNSRICQFRIQKKMDDVSFYTVDTLGNENRGGFGSSGTM